MRSHTIAFASLFAMTAGTALLASCSGGGDVRELGLDRSSARIELAPAIRGDGGGGGGGGGGPRDGGTGELDGGEADGGGGGGGETDGGTTTAYGNNLANPVIFAEGIGLGGLPVTGDAGEPLYANTGLRPTAAEGIAVTTELPFTYFLPNPEYQTTIGDRIYYKQQTPNTWQAQWLDATKTTGADGGVGVANATVDWADNLVRQTWTTNSVVRVEIVLDDLLKTAGLVTPALPEPARGQLMSGLQMQLLAGTGKTEMWGTNGDAIKANATIFSICPRLEISKCETGYSAATLTAPAECAGGWLPAVSLWTHDALAGENTGGLTAEINVSGKLIYGYNWMVRNMPTTIKGTPITKDGWWRLEFKVDDGGGTVDCNLSLDNLYPTDLHSYYAAGVAAPTEGEVGTDPVLYEPKLSGNSTYVDVQIKANRGGGKR